MWGKRQATPEPGGTRLALDVGEPSSAWALQTVMLSGRTCGAGASVQRGGRAGGTRPCPEPLYSADLAGSPQQILHTLVLATAVLAGKPGAPVQRWGQPSPSVCHTATVGDESEIPTSPGSRATWQASHSKLRWSCIRYDSGSVFKQA